MRKVLQCALVRSGVPSNTDHPDAKTTVKPVSTGLSGGVVMFKHDQGTGCILLIQADSLRDHADWSQAPLAQKVQKTWICSPLLPATARPLASTQIGPTRGNCMGLDGFIEHDHRARQVSDGWHVGHSCHGSLGFVGKALCKWNDLGKRLDGVDVGYVRANRAWKRCLREGPATTYRSQRAAVMLGRFYGACYITRGRWKEHFLRNVGMSLGPILPPVVLAFDSHGTSCCLCI